MKWLVINLTVAFTLLLPMASSAEPFKLTESELIRLSRGETPNSLTIDASRLQSELAHSGYRENFSTDLVSSLTYQDSKEKAFAPFIPVFGPSTMASVGVEKGLLHGGKASFNVFTTQQSTTDGSIDRATRTGLRAGFTFDIWKNFLGRLNKAQLSSLELQKEKAQLESEVNRKSYELNLRKVYWSLVANQKAVEISQNLFKQSQRQLTDAKARLRQSISDKGEVAKYEAQLADRSATLAGLEYQRRVLVESLQQQLPELSGKEVEVSGADIPVTVKQVLACTLVIQRQTGVPWDHTRSDEIVKLLERQYNEDQKVTDSHSGVDLQLTSNIQVSGVDQGYGRSFTDLRQNGQMGYEVGVAFRMPLSSPKKDSEQLRREMEKKLFLAQKKQLLLKIRAQHTQISQMINYLYETLNNQQKKSQSLQISAKEMERKYRQARASVADVVREQDALQSSLLSEVQTQLAVIHVLLDYFQLYTETPCELNQAGNV